MQQSIERPELLEAIRRGCEDFPIVALLGSRQMGKTTLANAFAAGRSKENVTFYDLERAADEAAHSSNAEHILSQHEGLVIIDEVQRLPQLIETQCPIVDLPKVELASLVIGSASWELIKGVAESLAGRIHFIDVGAFSLGEVSCGSLNKLWLRGGSPRAFLANDAESWQRWMDNFARTFWNAIFRCSPLGSLRER